MDPEREDDEPRRLSDHLKVYVSEPTLWPVVLVAVAIFVTMGIAALLSAWAQRNVFAMAAVALLAGMSVDQIWRELRSGGVGWVTGLVCTFWGLSLAGAFAIVQLGWF